ncbi:MAG UNVERIFIED_CONTAM: hypothetical protein LVT10_09035 [Anaerolineae bacterium]
MTETHHVQQLGKDRYVSTARVQEVAQRITSTVKTFLHENPHYFGMKPHVLMSMLNIDMEMLMVAIHQASHDLMQTPEGMGDARQAPSANIRRIATPHGTGISMVGSTTV